MINALWIQIGIRLNRVANVLPGRNKGNGTGESISGTSVVHGEAEALILGTVTVLELAAISRLSDPTCNHNNCAAL